MDRFVTKHFEIEAVQFDGRVENATMIIDWVLSGGGTARFHAANDSNRARIAIDTFDGVVMAGPGDWVARNPKGQFFRCDPEVFNETYDPYPEIEPGSFN